MWWDVVKSCIQSQENEKISNNLAQAMLGSALAWLRLNGMLPRLHRAASFRLNPIFVWAGGCLVTQNLCFIFLLVGSK